MSSSVDIVGGTASTTPVVASASTASASARAATTSAATTTSASTEAAVVVHSPRTIGDPTVGFITEYLSNNGEVIGQSPSAVAVAYMRGGLAADGSPKGGYPVEKTTTA